MLVECLRKHERVRIRDILEVIAQFSQKGAWTDQQLLIIYRKANPGVLVGVGGSGLFKGGPPAKVQNKRSPFISFAAEEFIRQQQRLLRKKKAA